MEHFRVRVAVERADLGGRAMQVGQGRITATLGQLQFMLDDPPLLLGEPLCFQLLVALPQCFHHPSASGIAQFSSTCVQKYSMVFWAQVRQ